MHQTIRRIMPFPSTSLRPLFQRPPTPVWFWVSPSASFGGCRAGEQSRRSRNRAFNLLIEKGLNAEEARARMAMTAQRTKLSLLSKAADYAGLDLGEVVSEEERLAAENKQRLMPSTAHPRLPTRMRVLPLPPMSSPHLRGQQSSRCRSRCASFR